MFFLGKKITFFFFLTRRLEILTQRDLEESSAFGSQACFYPSSAAGLEKMRANNMFSKESKWFSKWRVHYWAYVF